MITRPHTVPVTLAFLVVILAFSIATAVVGVDRALADPLSCGDTITVDTTLDADLLDCPSTGIVIGADDITLDLNGHTIDGDDTLVDPCHEGNCDFGVLNDQHNGVTITGGDISGFVDGVFIFRARRNGVSHLSVFDNDSAGIFLIEAINSHVRWNHASRNGAPFINGVGIIVFRSHHNRIAHNKTSRNGYAGLDVSFSNHNQIRSNTLRRNAEEGIYLVGDGNEIIRNRLRRCGITIAEEAVGNVVRRNLVRDADRNGIAVGLVADLMSRDTIISHNRVFGSGGDGINVQSSGTTLTGNEARRNHDLGIRAVEGVVDGGGNLASGNGDRRQCVNVSCDPYRLWN